MTRLAAAMLLFAVSASAEVRIEQHPDGPSLGIRAAARGVWTPSPSSDRRSVLNASGDLLGDGFPAQARDAGRLLVAWNRPATSELLLVEADASGGQHAFAVPVQSTHGTPMPLVVGDGWVVLSQVGGTNPAIAGLGIKDATTTPVTTMQDGLLLAAQPTDDGLLVATLDVESNELLLGSYVVNVANPVPIPIEWLRVRAATETSSSPADGALIEPQVCMTRTDDGGLVAWSEPRGLLGFVRLRDGRLSGPTYRNAVGGSCTAVLRAASR